MNEFVMLACRIIRCIRPGALLACAAVRTLSSGCASTPQEAGAGDPVGRTYYIDGAGNWGYGVLDVAEGLRRAGYRGHVINYRWSPTFNPALDQTIGRPVAKLKGKSLGEEINTYLKKYPQNQVNIIALSAGTGVAVWACEVLEPPAMVNNLILLGASISSTYDMTIALSHISGGVWVYYSGSDQILGGPVRALGTIDGKLGVEAAGLVGLHPKSGDSDKIHNIPWSAKYERYGWTGAHTDATSEPFVRSVLARLIVPPPTGGEDHASNSPHGQQTAISTPTLVHAAAR